MKRYTDIEIVKNGGRRSITTVDYPIIPPKINDTYIITKFGDRLDNIAWEYYKDPSLWWIIARANGINGGSMFPEVGVQLRIPDDIESIISEYKEINNIE